jgi:hypothetical protein
MAASGKLFFAVLAIGSVAGWHHHQSEPTSHADSYESSASATSGSYEAESDGYAADGSSEPETFAGYQCTSDCSGHYAGYDWAEEKGIDDEDVCDGLNTNSESFKEGCKAFVNGGDRSGEDDVQSDGSGTASSDDAADGDDEESSPD